MEMLRVGIAYEPPLVAEVIARALFDRVASVTVVEPPFSDVDVVVFPLTDSGKPDMDILPGPAPRGAKLVAVSPGLDVALVRLPGADKWEEVRPFGLDEIFSEVLAGRQRPVNVMHKVSPRPRPRRVARAVRRRFKWPAWLWPQLVVARQWAASFAALVVVLSVSVSAMAISTQSLPGELLYSVKRLTESVQLALAPPASKPDVHAARAQHRLEEIAALARQGIVMPGIVEDLDSELQAALDTAQALPGAEKRAFLESIAGLTQDHEDLLKEIAEQTDQDLENAVQVLVDRRKQAEQAIVGLPSPASTSTEPAQPTPTRTSPSPTRTPQPPGETPIPAGATSLPQPPDQNQVPDPSEFPEPTETREPTSTRTETPAPTQTPEPTSTWTETPAPTETPEPTPDPTETREPTGTPQPTETPGAGETPAPSETPEPTQAPVAGNKGPDRSTSV